MSHDRILERLRLPWVALLLGSALLASVANGQSPPAPPAGATRNSSREAMWPAPTAEDWKEPCLIQWQRTYEDALAVAKETGKPILVCINMDGEIASEHYAGIRYRQPEIAALYAPYVTVIASVYRHTPRDYDEQGHRILCPRFGSVTCGEHIAIEPGLFDKFLDGQRVAPRHIGVELDQKEMYDVFYAFDTDTIFNALRDGIANRPPPATTIVRGDRPLTERVASRDIADRIAVETAYQQGDRELRRTLLDAAKQQGEAAPLELLRLALFGFDPDLSQTARGALAGSASPDAPALISHALRVPMETTERDALVAALRRLGESSPRARTLAVVQQGLATRSSVLDVEAWSAALGSAVAQAGSAPESSPSLLDAATIQSRLENQSATLAAKDPIAHLELAEAFLASALASEQEQDPEVEKLLFLDAQNTASAAEQLGATGWRVNGDHALAAYYLGDLERAHARAVAAVTASTTVPADPQGWNARVVLQLFAEARQLDLGKALREKSDWPASWLADIHAAYTLLARHPHGDDQQVVAHYDLLKWLGAATPAGRVLDAGLARFGGSSVLHQRLRTRLLEEKGIDGLEASYEARLRATGATSATNAVELFNLENFAGYASLVAA